jgi:hypothetical protein
MHTLLPLPLRRGEGRGEGFLYTLRAGSSTAMNRTERGERARRAADRRAAAQPKPQEKKPEPFRVLLAIHRPRYRARAERAAAIPGWKVRSLLNREDPIGLIVRERPDLFILSVDFARNTNVGYLRAAQRFRQAGLKIIALGETEDDAREAAGLCDRTFFPPWKTAELRADVADLYEQMRGEPIPAAGKEDADED